MTFKFFKLIVFLLFSFGNLTNIKSQVLTTSRKAEVLSKPEIGSNIITTFKKNHDFFSKSYVPTDEYDGFFLLDINGDSGYVHRSDIKLNNDFYEALKISPRNGLNNNVQLNYEEYILDSIERIENIDYAKDWKFYNPDSGIKVLEAAYEFWINPNSILLTPIRKFKLYSYPSDNSDFILVSDIDYDYFVNGKVVSENGIEFFRINHFGIKGYVQVDCFLRNSSYETASKILITEFESFDIRKNMKFYLRINSSKEKNLSIDESKLNYSNEKSSLPPIIKIEEIKFSNTHFDAESEEQLSLKVTNVGPGDGNNVFVSLSSDIPWIQFEKEIKLPLIPKNNGQIELNIPLKSDINLPDSTFTLKVQIIDKDFNQTIQGKQLIIPTISFKNPDLKIPKKALVEGQSANPNKQIDLNEMIKLKFALQNFGRGPAETVTVKVENNQTGLMYLGSGSNFNREQTQIPEIASGSYVNLEYNYLINSEFTATELIFEIEIKEKNGLFGHKEVLSFPFDSKLEDYGNVEIYNLPSNEKNYQIKIEDIQNFEVDVDQNIPRTSIKSPNTYALIIGNEDYQSRQSGLTVEQNVDFALNDAVVFGQYCNKTLGVPEKQIRVLKNATYAEIQQGLSWIENLAKIENGNAKLIFYYSGHGLPDQNTKEPYLIPVDVSGINLNLAIKLENVFNKLSTYPSKQITVFLDACFSGGARNESLVAMKGMKIKPEGENPMDNMIVFSSSTGEETSAVHRENQHGYFTYFFLKKLQETKGEVTLGELSEYISNSVSKATALDGIIQTPIIQVGENLKHNWTTMQIGN